MSRTACLLATSVLVACAQGVDLSDAVTIVPPSGGVPEGYDPNAVEAEADEAPEAGEAPEPLEAEGAQPAAEQLDDALPRGDQIDDGEAAPEEEDEAVDPLDTDPPQEPDETVDEEPPPATQPPATQPPATQPPVTQPPATQPPAVQPEPAVPGIDPLPTPELDPDPAITPALESTGDCLSAWEGSICDVCSSETQSDRAVCRTYIECYLDVDCAPGTCGGQDEACGVNTIGSGMTPKAIADDVYACLCD